MFTRIKNYINRKKNARTQNAFSSTRSVISEIDPETLQSITEAVTDLLDNDSPPSKNSHSTPTITPSPCKISHHHNCHTIHDSHDSGGYDCSDSGGGDCGGCDGGGGGGGD